MPVIKPDHEKQPGCQKQYVKITPSQLPLSCPRPEEQVWNMHPRVFLPIKPGEKVTCPYCSTQYMLVDDN